VFIRDHYLRIASRDGVIAGRQSAPRNSFMTIREANNLAGRCEIRAYRTARQCVQLIARSANL